MISALSQLAVIHLLLGSSLSLKPNQLFFQHLDETFRIEPIKIQAIRNLLFGQHPIAILLVVFPKNSDRFGKKLSIVP